MEGDGNLLRVDEEVQVTRYNNMSRNEGTTWIGIDWNRSTP